MLDRLRSEGLNDLECLAVTQRGVTWEQRASGFDEITFPVLPDTNGEVFDVFSADPYNGLLIDKQGRMVSRVAHLDNTLVDQLTKRIRQLHAE